MDARMEISPYLPETDVQFAWDSTSLGYIKRCARLYQYEKEGWKSKDESVHLRFGSEYHDSLREYEVLKANGVSHNDAVREVVYGLLVRTSDWNPDRDTKAGKVKNPETLLRTVIWHLDEYEKDEAKTVLWSDGSPAVEQSFRFELDWGPETARNEKGHWIPNQPYVLCGHLDRIVNYMGERFVLDYKTTTWWITQSFFDRFEPDNQMSLYALATKVVLNSPVRGIIIDAAKIEKDKTTFARGLTYRTPDQLAEWVNDLRHWLAYAEQRAIKGYWPQNDTACDKYGGCKYREVCTKSPKMRERFLNANFTKLEEGDRWNPLKTR